MTEPVLNSPGPDNLAGQIACLRRQITLLLLALIVVSGTLVAYLFYQSHILGREADSLQPIVRNYNQNLPRIRQFVSQLTAYGQKHSDFQSVLKKYGIPLTNAPAAAAPASRK